MCGRSGTGSIPHGAEPPRPRSDRAPLRKDFFCFHSPQRGLVGADTGGLHLTGRALLERDLIRLDRLGRGLIHPHHLSIDGSQRFL